jgi:hypothetical protein
MLSMALAALDSTVVSTAVPQIVGDLGGLSTADSGVATLGQIVPSTSSGTWACSGLGWWWWSGASSGGTPRSRWADADWPGCVTTSPRHV